MLKIDARSTTSEILFTGEVRNRSAVFYPFAPRFVRIRRRLCLRGAVEQYDNMSNEQTRMGRDPKKLNRTTCK